MNNIEDKLIEIFCHIDDFNSVFINELQTHQLTDGSRKRIKQDFPIFQGPHKSLLMIKQNHPLTDYLRYKPLLQRVARRGKFPH